VSPEPELQRKLIKDRALWSVERCLAEKAGRQGSIANRWSRRMGQRNSGFLSFCRYAPNRFTTLLRSENADAPKAAGSRPKAGNCGPLRGPRSARKSASPLLLSLRFCRYSPHRSASFSGQKIRMIPKKIKGGSFAAAQELE